MVINDTIGFEEINLISQFHQPITSIQALDASYINSRWQHSFLAHPLTFFCTAGGSRDTILKYLQPADEAYFTSNTSSVSLSDKSSPYHPIDQRITEACWDSSRENIAV